MIVLGSGLSGLGSRALAAGLHSLLTPAAASAQVLQADFDGDGIRDQVIGGSQPTDLLLHLSKSPQPQRLHLRQPILHVTAADIDHDGDCDIIATTAQPGLDIFVNQGRGRFRAVHARAAPRMAAVARPCVPARRRCEPRADPESEHPQRARDPAFRCCRRRPRRRTRFACCFRLIRRTL